MTVLEMLGQSGLLTLMGIGIVFIFLIILIISVTGVHRIVKRLGWDVVEEKVGTQPQSNNALIAAIVASVHEYEGK